MTTRLFVRAPWSSSYRCVASHFYTDTTKGWVRQFGNPEYDWGFQIEPQPKAKNAQGFRWHRYGSLDSEVLKDPAVTAIHRAKSLGGSSVINAMIYTKPGRDEIDGASHSLMISCALVHPENISVGGPREPRMELGQLPEIRKEGRKVCTHRYTRPLAHDPQICTRLCVPERPVPDEAFRSTYNPDSVGHDGAVCMR